MTRRKRWVWIVAAVWMGLSAYTASFFYFVKEGHVSYLVPPDENPPPPNVMFVSTRSKTANRAARIIYYPIIWAYEVTGEYIFIVDASGFD